MQRGSGNSTEHGINIKRLISVLIIFFVICALFVVRMLYLQVIDSEKYKDSAVAKAYKTAVLSAQRGEVYDRNGEKLISNVLTHNIEINRTTLASGASFEVLSELIDILEKYDTVIPDNAPLTENFPYVLDSDYIFDKQKTSDFNKFLKINEIDKNYYTGEEFYSFLAKKFNIPEEHINTPKGRKIIGIRYDMEVNDFSTSYPYVLLTNVDDKILTEIAERKHLLHGIEISKSYTRTYNNDYMLCHILGRVGPIFAEEAQEYIVEKGYSYNAVIGKDGIEKVFEEELRGIDGTARYEIDEDNNIVGYNVVDEPKEGYSVRLTIDAKLQEIVEKSLGEQIKIASESSYLYGGVHAGEDCDSGACVVVDVKNGETLALASYPLFNRNTYSKDIGELNANPANPQLNRATQGIYPPGSTFKILTAAAALDSGIVSSGDYIYDKGVYEKYAPTYTPRCWIYLRNGTTHGYVNVYDALKVSCNYYFYSVADKLGVDTIVKYASDFGLGVKTGIEVYESSGILASPEYKELNGYVWNPGDTLQMAIGQSDHAFTPIQLAQYMATVVNGGNRYKSTILKSVDEFYTGIPVYKNESELYNTTSLSEDTVNVIKSAMRSVVDEQGGTAQGVFLGKSYAKDIGGKTGTAQVSNGSDTVLFVGFAPYDDPEIAVAVVIENGYKSARAATVASKVFDYYFENMYN